MRRTWQRAVVLGALTVGLVRCFSSSGSSGTSTCNAWVQSATSSACGACLQSQCSAQVAAAESPCSDFVSCVCGKGGNADSCASDLQETSCQAADQAVQSCANVYCAASCPGPGDASVPEGGHDATMESGPDSSAPDTSVADSSTPEGGPDGSGPEAGADSAADANEEACPTGDTVCSGTCVNTSTDNDNCGTCANACTGGETCVTGTCSCPAGQTFCGAACTNTSTDNGNCGKCGNACTAPETCVSGACTLVCASPTTACGLTCTNTMTDPNNCGGCGNVCGPYTNASPGCDQGTCTYACLPGWLDCGSTTGCDTNGTVNGNCGACGYTCPFPNCACTDGTCTPNKSCG